MNFEIKLIPFRLVIFTALAVNMTLSLTSCGSENVGSKRSYELIWSDEFDGANGTSPNAENWIYDIGTGSNGWGNNELQYYTDRPENVKLDGEGHLVITALQESYLGRSYTSARIKTQGLFSTVYGRIEARLKTPFGAGLWPAFWMLGNNITSVGWPQCGEIDIMELRGQFPSRVAGTVHGPGYSGGASVGSDFELTNARFDTEFHVFAVEWGEDFLEFYVDDRMFHRVTPSDVNGEWVFDDEFFILLNVAVGGNYVGPPNGSTLFPQKMTVDYVRVYEEVN